MRLHSPKKEGTMTKVLPDGRIAMLVPLYGGRARITLSKDAQSGCYDRGY
jgi:hypothetical protein